jgi:glutamine cyclotransferase
VPKLNELEFVDGMVLANIWYDGRVAVIDPETAEVSGLQAQQLTQIDTITK